MAGRSSRPRSSPARTPPQLVRQIVGLRWWRRLGPVRIGGQPGIPASTVHAVLARCRISRLPRTGRVTGEPARRYEHGHPGSLIHVDITKFASIPDGGGHRFLGRDQGKRKCPCHRPPRRRAWPGLTPQIGTACLHIVIDDHSRVACAEICADEKAQTAAAVLHRALAWLAARGITPERVLSDSCYRSSAWREACAELGITHKGSRPLPPPDDGKTRRFHRTLADGWGLHPALGLRNHQPPGPAWLAPRVQITTGPTAQSSATRPSAV